MEMTHRGPDQAARKDPRPARSGPEESETFMCDLIFIGAMVVFFVVSALYVRFCEKL